MARGYQPGLRKTLKAAGDLSARRYNFVKVSAAQTVTVSGAGEVCDGILQNAPDAANKSAAVMLNGTSKCRVNGNSVNIAAGDYIKAAANGVGVKASSGDVVGGRALDAATADDVFIEVVVLPAGSKMP